MNYWILIIRVSSYWNLTWVCNFFVVSLEDKTRICIIIWLLYSYWWNILVNFLEMFTVAKDKNTSMIASALASAEERLVPSLLLPCVLWIVCCHCTHKLGNTKLLFEIQVFFTWKSKFFFFFFFKSYG